MKLAATPYLFYPYSTSSALSSLSLYVVSRMSVAIISVCQTKKTNNNETFLFMQNTEGKYCTF